MYRNCPSGDRLQEICEHRAHKMQAYRMYGVLVVLQGFVGWHLSKTTLCTLTHFDLTAQVVISG